MATDLKSRRRLLKALEVLSPPTAASAFVLLWTWFREVGLGSVENALRARPKGQRLASASAEKGELLHTLECIDRALAVDWCQADDRLAVATYANAFELWDLGGDAPRLMAREARRA